MSEAAQAPRRKALAIAVEMTFALAAVSNTAFASTYFVTNTNDAGAGSLRQAISSANGAPGQPALVQFQSGVTGTITLTTGEIAITQPINVQGPGSSVVTVSAGGTSRIFNVQSTSTNPATVSGLTLQNGYSATTGGAVYVSASHFTLTDSVVQNSVADTSGGGIGSTGASYITLTNDTFDSNLSPRGCAFNLVAKQATITGVVSQNNTCTSGGGGNIIGSTTITSSRFLNNTGGGLYVAEGSAYISNSEFSGNYITRYGGGIGLTKVTGATIANTTISGNYAILGGGGVALINNQNQSNIVVKHSTIDGNKVKVNTANHSAATGGGLFLKAIGTNTLAIGYSTISNNQAGNGGGLFVTASNSYVIQASLYDTTIAGNVAAYSIGGASIASGTSASSLTVESTTIAGNSASKIGGIAFRVISTLHDSIVANNIVPAGASNPDIIGNVTVNFSLIGDTTGTTVNGANNLLNVDPMLGPLGDYGGGIATMRPRAGSPAIDAGDPAYDTSTSPAHDERGLGRVVGTAIDMGAVEIQASEDTIFLDGFESG